MNFRTDMAYNIENDFSHEYYLNHKNIEVLYLSKKNCNYKLIYFSNMYSILSLKKVIKNEIQFFLDKYVNNYNFHILVVGLGNINHTADSIGAKAINYIQVNSHLENLGIDITYPKISTLEPGVLGKTGIDTTDIIKSIVSKVKCDIILLVDSFVTDDFKYLNHTIEITDEGITPGSGLKGLNKEISKKTLGIPVIVIGVPSAMEIKKEETFLISLSNIDEYVLNISQLIGESINELLHLT